MNFKIETRSVGPDFAPLVVAEIGINHNGDLNEAKLLVDSAANAGAEIIKHQTHIPDAEMSQEARNVKPGNADISIYEVIENCSLNLDEERLLAEYVRSKGLIFMSTPFSFEALEFLETLDVPAYKIGSGECNNYPLVEAIASKGKPVIMSTGMNSIESITPSVEIFREYGVPFALMHCTNLYPTPDKLIRLNSLNDLRTAFPDAVLGLSDHSLTNYPCLASVSLGASILERHFTDSKERGGPDIICSMTPVELRELIEGSKIIFDATKGEKFPVKEEDVTIAFAFASVVTTRKLCPGDVLTREDITLKRPSGGDFGPKDFKNLIGKTILNEIEPNLQIKRNQIRE
ncbi:SpsE Sialic acid synthase [Candidatus Nanopelagicaceae bacterium]